MKFFLPVSMPTRGSVCFALNLGKHGGVHRLLISYFVSISNTSEAKLSALILDYAKAQGIVKCHALTDEEVGWLVEAVEDEVVVTFWGRLAVAAPPPPRAPTHSPRLLLPPLSSLAPSLAHSDSPTALPEGIFCLVFILPVRLYCLPDLVFKKQNQKHNNR
jgi:hypothetical protein